MPKTVRQVLAERSTYYRNLNQSNQTRFEQRLADLLEYLNFSDQNLGSVVTMEMKLVVASAQIQLTFGLDRFLPLHYDQIVLLPNAYRLVGYDQPVVGHIDPKKSIIYLSWRDVEYGFSVSDDAVNVALHEFAHWLELESRIAKFCKSLLCKFEFSDWRRQAERKLLVIRSNDHSFLKDYGGRNMRELFAVCVEAFFEQSESFKQKLPHLYQPMVELLNQDPTDPANPLIEDD